jgi:hypothetical protein
MTSDSHFTLPVTTPLVQEKLTKTPVTSAHARCTQCGASMRHMPMFLKNITCRDCYGLDRYRRGDTTMPSAHRPLATPTPEEAPAS